MRSIGALAILVLLAQPVHAAGGGLPAPEAAKQARELSGAAEAQAERMEYTACAETLRRVLELTPNNARAGYNLACCLARAGSAEEALGALDRAVEAGFWETEHIRLDPDLHILHASPGFERVLHRSEALARRALTQDPLVGPSQPAAVATTLEAAQSILRGRECRLDNSRVEMGDRAWLAHSARLLRDRLATLSEIQSADPSLADRTERRAMEAVARAPFLGDHLERWVAGSSISGSERVWWTAMGRIRGLAAGHFRAGATYAEALEAGARAVASDTSRPRQAAAASAWLVGARRHAEDPTGAARAWRQAVDSLPRELPEMPARHLLATSLRLEGLTPFETVDLEGNRLRPAHLLGRTVVYQFVDGGDRCRRSRAASGVLNPLHETWQRLSGHGLEVVLIETSDAPDESVGPWLQAYASDWTVIRAGGRVADHLGVKYVPEAILVDPQGRVIDAGLTGKLLERTLLTVVGARPEIDAVAVTGERVRTDDLLGREAAVYFWSTGCGACFTHLPKLQATPDRAVVLINVDGPEAGPRVRAWAREQGLSGLVLHDADGTLRREFGVELAPSSFLLDREGRIVEHRRSPDGL